MGQWHSLECLESGTVILEAKDGKYEPLGEDEIMETLPSIFISPVVFGKDKIQIR